MTRLSLIIQATYKIMHKMSSLVYPHSLSFVNERDEIINSEDEMCLLGMMLMLQIKDFNL